MTRFFQTICILAYSLYSASVFSDAERLQIVKVAEPFLEMHTGAGAGYPIFNVIERGESLKIIMQRSNWYKVQNQKGIEGWVSFKQISKTTSLNNESLEFTELNQEDFTQRNWEWGVLGGDFGGAPVFSAYGSYMFNPNFATELSFSQSIGGGSSSIIYRLGLVMQPFPDWEYSPYFQMGTGVIKVEPSVILVQPVDQSDQISSISVGIRTHLTQQIIIRLEYSEYVIFSANNDNDNNGDIKEWKAGFAIFF